MAVERPGVFGISAPPREAPAPVETPLKKPAPVPPAPDKQPPKTEKPWIQRMVGSLGVRIGLGVLAVGGAGYAARETISNNIPGISRSAEKPAPFDNAKLDTEKQTIVLGKNAREATPEDIQILINTPFPQEKPDKEIKTPADLPQAAILLSLDSQKAGKIEVSRSGPIVQAGPLEGQQVPSFLKLVVENSNTPLGVAIPQGVNTDSVEVFLAKPTMVNGRSRYLSFYEKFNLGNGKYAVMEIRADVLPTELLRDAPIIDPNRPKGLNYLHDVFNEQGKRLSIIDNPTLAFTRTKDTMVDINLFYGTSNNNWISGSGAILHPQSQNESILISSPR